MIIRRALNILRRHGVGYFLKRITELMRRASYTKSEVLFRVDLNESGRGLMELPEGVTLGHAAAMREVPSELLEQAYAQKTEAIVSHYMRHFFARGAHFWYLTVDSTLVGVCWSTVSDGGLFYFSPLAPDEAIIEATEVYPAYRGKGYNPLMIKAVFDALANRGVRRVYMSSKKWNTPSLRSLAKTGLREAGSVRRFELFGKRITIWDR